MLFLIIATFLAVVLYIQNFIDKLYNDGETTYESIAVQARFSELKLDIIKAVVNLYLKKKIIFEK